MWQRLGIRTFIIYILRGFLPGLFLLFLSFVILWAKNAIDSNTASVTIQLGSFGDIIAPIAGFLAVIAFPIMGLGIFLNIIRYFSAKYILEEDVFRIHHGIISRHEISIPYEKIEDVDLDQSILGRILGVGKLYIITGGREEPGKRGATEAVFTDIDFSKAKYLQKELMVRGSVQKVRSV